MHDKDLVIKKHTLSSHLFLTSGLLEVSSESGVMPSQINMMC